MTMTTDREIGRLSAEVANLQREVSRQGEIIQEMRDILVASKGSWRTLAVLGSIVIALTSAITSIVIKFWPGQ